MAKTAPLKKSSKPISVRSRSAKRASSPSINLDKSLKLAKPPLSSSNNYHSVLSTHHDSGVSKKNKKGKQISRQQRRRQEKGFERAEAVMDKTDKKIIKSLGKQRVIKSRRAAWDELNGKISASQDPKGTLDHEVVPEEQDSSSGPEQVSSERLDSLSPSINIVSEAGPLVNAEEDEIT